MSIKEGDKVFGVPGVNWKGEMSAPFLIGGSVDDPDDLRVLSFDIYCRRCGYGLCKLTDVVAKRLATSEKRSKAAIYVEPCPVCSGEPG